MAVYQRLLFNNLLGLLGNGFPVCVRLLGEPVRPVTVCFLEPILQAEHEGRRRIATLARARIEQAMAAA